MHEHRSAGESAAQAPPPQPRPGRWNGRQIIAVVSVAAIGWAPALADRIESPGRASSFQARAEQCISFESNGHLRYGESFGLGLPRDLVLELTAGADFGWVITVSRRGGTFDYIWVVSPPFQTAPHLSIGPAYGVSARESVAFRRELRFVLSDEAYNAALKVVKEQQAGPAKLRTLERIGPGRLTIDVLRAGFRKATRPELNEALDWIEFKGQACVPR